MYIEIDREAKKIKTDRSWQFGIGNDHAYNLHRVDACAALKKIHDELGIRYVRFHGIFDDDMLVVQSLTDYKPYRGIPNASKVQEINFKQIYDVFDNVMDCGFLPWVELSFMPSALAKGKKTGIRYLNNICKPKNLQRWSKLIEQFVKGLINRYGKEVVESFYFEVWNEPDLPIFFKGNQKDYFKLYKATALAVKKVDSDLKVGGPSSSACKWIKDFVKFCKDEDVPYDFISTHHYPGDAFGNSFSIKDAFKMMAIVNGSAKNKIDITGTLPDMFYHPEVYKTWSKGALRRMDEKAVSEADKPLFITEFNSMAVYASPIHDEKYSAAFLVKTLLDIRGDISGYMFWCASDIYEEQFMLGSPFHGGFGLINNCGIPKPNFYAFKMLSKLYDDRLDLGKASDDKVEYAVFIKGDKTQVMIYAQSSDPNEDIKYDIKLKINKQAKKVNIERIDDYHCNPKCEWLKMNGPSSLTKKQTEEIIDKTKLLSEPIDFINQDGSCIIDVSLHTNDVILLEVE